MRIIVFFDLPTETAKDRREYSKFRKFLISEGFIMMQESIYSKLALNNSIVISEKEKINKNKPPKGIVQLLTITEKQFSEIEYIVGNSTSNILDNTERLIIL
ncbi:MAG: CRISPR-associated endonuclease Cas2 [Clostridia bacterium]|nr:CRISPR-associated endonuclease Cas2 [Clostridia bacterium]